MAEPTSMTLGAPVVLALTSTTAATAAAFGTDNPGQPGMTKTHRIACDAAAWVAVGTAPTADIGATGSFYLPADSVEYIDIPLGHKVAGITASTATLSITPCTKV